MNRYCLSFFIFTIFRISFLYADNNYNDIILFEPLGNSTRIRTAYFTFEIPQNTGYCEGIDIEGYQTEYVICLTINKEDHFNFIYENSIEIYTPKNKVIGYYRLVEKENNYYEALISVHNIESLIVFQTIKNIDDNKVQENWEQILDSLVIYNEPRDIDKKYDEVIGKYLNH